MNQPCIDTVMLEELAASTDITFVGELIEAYYEETPRYIAMMKAALLTSDAEAFRRAAHTIKSTSATLGVIALAEEAKALERMGRENQLHGAAAKVDEFSDHFAHATTTLEDWRHA